MKNLTLIQGLILLTLTAGIPTRVNADDEFSYNILNAFKKGQTQLEVRLRHEESHQQNLQLASATTVRSDLNFTTAEVYKLKVVLGLVDVTSIFANKYNPDLSNITKQQYAKIYDPAGTGLTQANLMISGIPDTEIIIGRQYLMLDNERFIGKDDFRQFPQNFDAITLSSKAIADLEFFYSFVLHVNTNIANARVFDALGSLQAKLATTNPSLNSGRRRLRTHLVNINWSAFEYGNIGAYGYFNNDRSMASNSNVTYGLRIFSTEEKNYKNVNYLIEVARQDDKYNNITHNHRYYWHFILGKTFEYASTAIAWEHLGKNLSTALGSLHEFNGIADVFHTQNFIQGLNDFYISFNTGTPQISGEISAHLFEDPNLASNKIIGYEYDLSAELHLTNNITLSASYAYFKSKNITYPNTNKFWLMLAAKFL